MAGKRFYAFGEDIYGTVIKQSVTNMCETWNAVQAGTPMAVNGNDTLALGLARVFFVYSHSIVPGGLEVIS